MKIEITLISDAQYTKKPNSIHLEAFYLGFLSFQFQIRNISSLLLWICFHTK